MERIGGDACEYCPYGNPCLDCPDYSFITHDCTSNGACYESYDKHKPVRSSEHDTTITEKEEI